MYAFETRTVIDAPTAMRMISEVVEDHGSETVYEKPNGTHCFYVHEGKPSCLIGHVLNRAGVSVDALEAMQYGAFSMNIGAVRAPEGFVFTEGARRVMTAAQVAQDLGQSWGVARVRALAVLDHLPIR